MNVSKLKPAFLAPAILALMSACATPIKFEGASDTTSATIAVVGPENPKSYGFITSGKMWGDAITQGVGGAAGALVGESIAASSAPARITAIAAQQDLKLGDEFAAAFGAALQNAGWITSHEIASRKNPDDLIQDYSTVPGNETTILDAAILAIYYQDGMFGGKTYPWVQIVVTAADRATHKLIFRQLYLCSSRNYGGATKSFVVPSSSAFDSHAEMYSNPDRVVAGFRYCVAPVAADVASKLRLSP